MQYKVSTRPIQNNWVNIDFSVLADLFYIGRVDPNTGFRNVTSFYIESHDKHKLKVNSCFEDAGQYSKPRTNNKANTEILT